MVDLLFVLLFYCGTGHAIFWTGWRRTGRIGFDMDLEMAGPFVLGVYYVLFLLAWPFLLAGAIEGACRE